MGKVKLVDPKDRPTEKQRKFVELYLTNGKSAPQAYLDSHDVQIRRPDGFCTQGQRAKSYELLKNIKIRRLISEAEAKAHAVTTKVFEKYAITQERVLEELARIAFSNNTDVVEWDKTNGVTVKDSKDVSDDAKSAISEITEVETKEGKKVRIKMADKKAALDTLAKHLGLLAEKHEHKHMSVNFIIEDK